MTNDALLAVQCIFTNAWKLFTSWRIPGTNVSPAMWFVFILVGFMGFKMLFTLLGMSNIFSAYNIGDASAKRRNEQMAHARKNFDDKYSLERKYDPSFANHMANKDFNEWKNLKGYK